MYWRTSRYGTLSLLKVLSIAAVQAYATHAFAQNADTAAAEALFEQGKQLLRAGNAAAACPKLAESQRIDPSTGTLLALAMCHEAEGKLASAWAEFVSVEARARNEGRPDREQAAQARAQALKPRLSTLEIRVAPEVAALPGLEVRRDGSVVGRGAWNVVVPVDGGDHVVEVTATGRTTWRGKASLKAESDTALLAVPMLAALPPSKKEGEPRRDEIKPARWGGLEWTGVAVAGAGVIGLGVGGYFLSNALSHKSESSKDCDGNMCGPVGASERRSAVSSGNTATIFGIAGGVLAAGGATIFVLGRKHSRGAEAATTNATELGFSAGPAGLAARYSTSF